MQTTDLTKREREVAALVAEGLTNRGIADRLGISERTATPLAARRVYSTAFPDAKLTIEREIAEGDYVVQYLSTSSTHSGPPRNHAHGARRTSPSVFAAVR